VEGNIATPGEQEALGPEPADLGTNKAGRFSQFRHFV
jgi:hypothetical protein